MHWPSISKARRRPETRNSKLETRSSKLLANEGKPPTSRAALGPAAGDRSEYVKHDRHRAIYHYPVADVGAGRTTVDAGLVHCCCHRYSRWNDLERVGRRHARIGRKLRLSARRFCPGTLWPL